MMTTSNLTGLPSALFGVDDPPLIGHFDLEAFDGGR